MDFKGIVQGFCKLAVAAWKKYRADLREQAARVNEAIEYENFMERCEKVKRIAETPTNKGGWGITFDPAHEPQVIEDKLYIVGTSENGTHFHKEFTPDDLKHIPLSQSSFESVRDKFLRMGFWFVIAILAGSLILLSTNGTN